jgi:hypothetical protein
MPMITDQIEELTSGQGIKFTGQLRGKGITQFAANDSGLVNAYAVTLTPAPTSYDAPMFVAFIAANTNTSTSCTMNVNAIGAVAIANLKVGDIIAGKTTVLFYNGTNFELINPSPVPSRSGNSGKLLTNNGASDSWVDALGFKNRFFNGAFDIWQRGTDNTSVASTRTYVADRWAVTAGGATLAHAQRSTTVPSGSRAKYSLELDGAASITTVDIDQRIEFIFIPSIKRSVTYSAKVYNGTGADFTPQLRIREANVGADDWSGTPDTGLAFTNLQACTNGQWTTVYWSGDVSAYTNLDNGAEFTLRIPSGVLIAGKTVRITEIQLEEGSLVTAFEKMHPAIQDLLCKRYFYNIAFGNGGADAEAGIGYAISSTTGYIMRPLANSMRSVPSVTVSSVSHFTLYPASVTPTSISLSSAAGKEIVSFDIGAASGLTANQGCLLRGTNPSARIDLSSEL